VKSAEVGRKRDNYGSERGALHNENAARALRIG
jgi:hypothetical protein